MVPLMTPVAGSSTGAAATYLGNGNDGNAVHALIGSDLVALELLLDEQRFLVAFNFITTSCD